MLKNSCFISPFLKGQTTKFVIQTIFVYITGRFILKSLDFNRKLEINSEKSFYDRVYYNSKILSIQ